MVDDNPRELTPEERREVREAQKRVEARLRTVEQAEAEGRLREMIRDVPSVREQLQPFLDEETSVVLGG